MSEQPAWRQDFAIDIAQDNYVARRDFMKFTVLTSLAFAVGQIWIGVQSALGRRRERPAARRIAAIDQVAIGAAISFAYPDADDACLLIRTGPDTFRAFSQNCTHLSCAVRPERPNVDAPRNAPGDGRLLCPCHKGAFDMATGRPIAGPPRRPLPRIVLEVRDGAVYATGVEVSTT